MAEQVAANSSKNDTTDAMEEEPPNSPAPVLASPGYLASRLNSVFSNALSHTLKTCSYGNFAACFPTPAARRPDVLQSVWQQVVGKIETKARSEYDSIMGERDVVRGLNELEALIGEARARRDQQAEQEVGTEVKKPVAPHTLPPESLFSANLAPQLEPMARELEAKTIAVAAENDQLAEGIGRQRDEMEALLRQLEAVVEDLEGANETLGDAVEEHGLKQEILDIQQDLDEVDEVDSKL